MGWNADIKKLVCLVYIREKMLLRTHHYLLYFQKSSRNTDRLNVARYTNFPLWCSADANEIEWSRKYVRYRLKKSEISDPTILRSKRFCPAYVQYRTVTGICGYTFTSILLQLSSPYSRIFMLFGAIIVKYTTGGRRWWWSLSVAYLNWLSNALLL